MLIRPLFLLLAVATLVSCKPAGKIRGKRQNMKVRINITSDTIVLKFVRPNPNVKLEGYILGYGSTMFSKQYIKLPEDGKPYETEMDAEPKYLVAVQPAPSNGVKKQCKEKQVLEKPLHLVVGSVTPTSVALTWGPLVKSSDDGSIMKDCMDDGNFTVRYREMNRKWHYQTCPTSDTVIDHLKPATPYVFSVRPNKPKAKGWSNSVIQNTPMDDKPKQRIIILKPIDDILWKPETQKPSPPLHNVHNRTRSKPWRVLSKSSPAPPKIYPEMTPVLKHRRLQRPPPTPGSSRSTWSRLTTVGLPITSQSPMMTLANVRHVKAVSKTTLGQSEDDLSLPSLASETANSNDWGTTSPERTTTSLPDVPHSLAVTVPAKKSTSGSDSRPQASSPPSKVEPSHLTTQDADGENREHHKGAKQTKNDKWSPRKMESSSQPPSPLINMEEKYKKDLDDATKNEFFNEVKPKDKTFTPKPRLPVTDVPVKQEPQQTKTATPTLEDDTVSPAQDSETITPTLEDQTTTTTLDRETITPTLEDEAVTPTTKRQTISNTPKGRRTMTTPTTTLTLKDRTPAPILKRRRIKITQKSPTTTPASKRQTTTSIPEGKRNTTTQKSPTTTTTTKTRPITPTPKGPKTTPTPERWTATLSLDGNRIHSWDNTSVFSPVPSSDVDAMGEKRFTATHVLYVTNKTQDQPCSITDTLAHFPEEEAGDLNVTGPPRVPPSNLTVVTVEGCPSFIILDWKKGDNETTDYEVTATAKSPNGKKVMIVNTNQTHAPMENLKPNSSYEFKVKPLNELGEGPSSDSVEFVTESLDPRVSEYVSGRAAIWTQFPFNADEYSECRGSQFVKRTWYRKFVGIQLCNSLRYKIYLSDSLKGKFYNIGDQTGHGEDHCQFVDSFLDGRTGNQLLSEQLPPRSGFYRAMRQEPVNFGEIGGYSRITYVPCIDQRLGSSRTKWLELYWMTTGPWVKILSASLSASTGWTILYSIQHYMGL
ncbi:hypothetical protein GJAV_G00209880 [Gymnothorax javanicus]|nr:hypothetical protein GJAV_G00209880 [Gymnothorax javanicus]